MSRVRVMQTFGEPRKTTNPYIIMLRDALVSSPDVEHIPFGWRTALTARYDVLHVHWADTLLSARHWWTRAGKRAAFAILLARLRWTGVAVVRTVHNVSSRGGNAIDRSLIHALERLTVLEIHLNPTTPQVSGTPRVLIPHGHYRDWYEAMPRNDARPTRLAYVGLIKPYKGVEALIDAFVDARKVMPQLELAVSGRAVQPELAGSLRAAADANEGLTVDLRYLSEEDFVAAITSSSLVVLPYREMHNSGTLLASLSLDRPVLVPANESNDLLAKEVGPDWVMMFEGDLTADQLAEAAQIAAEMTLSRPDLSAREWAGVGAQHASAYRAAMDSKGSARRHTHTEGNHHA